MRTYEPPRDESLDALATAAAELARRIVAAATAHGTDGEGGGLGATADDGHRDSDGLDAVGVVLTVMDRMVSAVIAVLQAADHHRVIAERGVTRDTWLRAVAGRTGSDAGMLLAAAERLGDMPAVTAWFQQGALSWGAIRQIVTATRNLTAAQRAWVDATLADHHADVARLDGDQVAAAVDGLANQARPDLHGDREANALARRWLSIQPRLDGTADIHGTLDPETAAAALAAFDTSAPDRHGHGGADDDGDGGDGDGMSDGDRVWAARRRANVDVFGDLCRQRVARRGRPHHAAHRSGGDSDAAAPGRHGDRSDGRSGVAVRASQATGAASDSGVDTAGGSCVHCGWAPSSARPAFLVVADLAALDPHHTAGSGAAQLLWATDHGPVELTAAAAQRLACDATLRVVITDDTQVLGVTAAHPKVSAALRAALIVRDGGCRFPGCAQHADGCDAHHVVPVIQNGPTVLDNMALVCRDHHHAIHDSGWGARLAADGSMTFTRRRVTLTSQPRVRQRPRPINPPPTGRPRRRYEQPPDRQAAADHDTDSGPSDDRDPGPVLLPF